jgi:hypothetical protein
LQDDGILDKFGLEKEYRKECNLRTEQLKTLIRICKLLNEYAASYAVFKTLMPFGAITNDIDIIHMGNSSEFEHIRRILSSCGYIEIKSKTDTGQVMFHDVAIGGSFVIHPKEKDVYDIDIYNDISASKMIYFDKRELTGEIISKNLFGTSIKVLKEEAELALEITHAIMPEMIFTLLSFYSTLYYLKEMNHDSIERFIYLSRKNCVSTAIRAHLTLTGLLHKEVFGFLPEKIECIFKMVNIDKYIENSLSESVFESPYRYAMITVLSFLIEKMGDPIFVKSLSNQIFSMMLNPVNIQWIISNLLWRRTRETY